MDETIRAYRPDDLQAISDAYNAVEVATGGDPVINPFVLQPMIEESGDPALDAFVVESAGRVIGFGGFTFFAAAGQAWARGVVHPDFWRRGIGLELVRRTDARILERAEAESPAGMSVTVDRFVYATNAGAVKLCEVTGHAHHHDSYEMRIALREPVEAPLLPEGFVLRPFTPEQARAVYDADTEAFAQNRDSVDMSFEEWSNVLMNAADIDISLWQVAYAGDEVAGYVMSRQDDPQGKHMYISDVGVRPAFRRRGLATALLRHSFAAFQARGAVGAALHVDTSNKTNAVGVYERAGMYVHIRVLIYRKVLRGAGK
jgi:ribosomal protein S18 acetylase RimI-like enzyme